MQFVDVQSEDSTFARIYPLDLPLRSSVFTATNLEIQVRQLFCLPRGWEPPHSRYLSTSAVIRHVTQGPFNMVKELWVQVHASGIKIPLEVPVLVLLVLDRERSLALASMVCSPYEKRGRHLQASRQLRSAD